MIPEEIWGLVPESLPLGVEPWEQIAIAETGLNDRQARAYLWAHAILRGARDAGIVPALERYLRERGRSRIADVTAGFIPFGDAESTLEPGLRHSLPGRSMTKGDRGLNSDKLWASAGGEFWLFGLVIGVETPAGPPSGEPRAEPLDLAGFNQTFAGPGPAFPYVIERRDILLDAPPNPSGAATSACYARPRSGKRYYSGTKWTDGILIARHVLLPSYAAAGATVPMASSSPATAIVGDIDASTTIDAAVLDSGTTPIPPAAKPLSLVAAVTPGLRVDVAGAHTTFSADVLRVMDDPNYFGNMVAHRAFIDAAGISGDSGALTSNASGGDAVGLYIGKTKFPVEGIVQLMRQVTTYFELDLYL